MASSVSPTPAGRWATCSRTCSCTARGCTCSATCGSSGSSATTSRPRWAAPATWSPICCAAALLQVFAGPRSVIPMVGASGAISGVMGAYLVLYPRVRVHCLVFLGFFFTFISLPAWTMLLYCMGIQVVSGLFSLVATEQGGVAFWAHVGGFVAGMALVKVFANSEMVREHREGNWQPRRLSARW